MRARVRPIRLEEDDDDVRGKSYGEEYSEEEQESDMGLVAAVKINGDDLNFMGDPFNVISLENVGTLQIRVRLGAVPATTTLFVLTQGLTIEGGATEVTRPYDFLGSIVVDLTFASAESRVELLVFATP